MTNPTTKAAELPEALRVRGYMNCLNTKMGS